MGVGRGVGRIVCGAFGGGRLGWFGQFPRQMSLVAVGQSRLGLGLLCGSMGLGCRPVQNRMNNLIKCQPH